MIYDKLLTVCRLDPDSGPRIQRLTRCGSYLYGEMEVYASRFFAAKQAGERIDRMAQLWPADMHADDFAVLWDAPDEVYRVVQAQQGLNEDGLPVTTLSLKREERRYELAPD